MSTRALAQEQGRSTGTRPSQGPDERELQPREDRRDCPRLMTRLRVDAGGVSMTTTNVSLTGMQISCPGLLFGLLTPALEAGGPLDVTLRFPDDDATARARCTVVYVAHYGYEYLIGVRFAEFEADGFEVLRRECFEAPAAPPDESASPA